MRLLSYINVHFLDSYCPTSKGLTVLTLMSVKCLNLKLNEKKSNNCLLVVFVTISLGTHSEPLEPLMGSMSMSGKVNPYRYQ